MIEDYFYNKMTLSSDNVYILDNDDSYSENFGKQWRDYRDIQIDSLNGFDISFKYLNDIFFDDLDIIDNKNILELGCGAGRFTEHIIKKCNLCFSVDMSQAIFYNVAKDSKNLFLIKSDFKKLNVKKKFDIVLCRGVLQHTPKPRDYLLKLFEFVNKEGYVIFDFYKKPKFYYFNLKYIFWRPLIKNLIKYEVFENYLKNNIKELLFIKRLIKKIFFLDIVSDNLIPIWDYKGKLDLNNNDLEKWAILDTLDGLYAKYDYPYSYEKIKEIINSNNLKLIRSNKKRNFFLCQK